MHSWHPTLIFLLIPKFCLLLCFYQACLICNYILKISITYTEIIVCACKRIFFFFPKRSYSILCRTYMIWPKFFGIWKWKFSQSLHQDGDAACTRYMRQQRMKTHWVTAWTAPEEALNAQVLIGHKQMGLITCRDSLLLLTSLQAKLLIWCTQEDIMESTFLLSCLMDH